MPTCFGNQVVKSTRAGPTSIIHFRPSNIFKSVKFQSCILQSCIFSACSSPFPPSPESSTPESTILSAIYSLQQRQTVNYSCRVCMTCMQSETNAVHLRAIRHDHSSSVVTFNIRHTIRNTRVPVSMRCR